MTPRSVRQGLLVAVVATLAGCHTLYPFERQDAAPADAAVADQAARDAAADADAGATPDAPREGPAADWPASDLPAGDLPASDLPASDLPASDLQPPDAGPAPDTCVPGVPPPTAAVCMDSEGAATNGCYGACAPADDLDCDGLKGPASAQDPWPTARNALLVSDGFSTAFGARWTAGSGVTQDLSAGTLALPMAKALFLKPSCATAFADTDYLVEARFTLSTPIYVSWIFQVHSAMDVLQHRLCRLAPSSGSTAALLVEASDTAGVTKSQTVTKTGVALNTGSTFVIQSWGTQSPASGLHTHVCRLLTPDGATELMTVSVDHPLTKPGSVAVGGDGRDFVLDHVRIYER